MLANVKPKRVRACCPEVFRRTAAVVYLALGYGGNRRTVVNDDVRDLNRSAYTVIVVDRHQLATKTRRLYPAELVGAFDATSRAYSLMNTCVQNEEFEDWAGFLLRFPVPVLDR